MLIIGIPVKNDLESLSSMFWSLLDSTRAYDKIIFIVGKGTNEKTMNFLNSLKEVEVINAQTKTPVEAYNMLFDIAKKEKADLFVTQTDVVFPKLYRRDWLEQMKRIAQYKDAGAVTCINGTGISGHDYINGLEWLGGWCTYFPFRTVKKIGGYDKDFPFDWGVDIEHTYRIYLAGLKIVKINYWCDHHMLNDRRHETNPNAEKQKQECAKYFRKKYKLGEFKE